MEITPGVRTQMLDIAQELYDEAKHAHDNYRSWPPVMRDAWILLRQLAEQNEVTK